MVNKHNKVKTGCRTCKIRKVKCDESWPACRRCVSTGRFCSGYGIWGGGGGSSHCRSYSDQSSLPDETTDHICARPQRALSIHGLREIEKPYHDWLKLRTAMKLPGSFQSTFWTTLIFQASAEEPAIRHAALALSSFHKHEIISADCDNDGTGYNRFTLQQYSESIQNLKSKISIRDRSSLRTALITCILYFHLELLRGYFEAAEMHFDNGMKIMAEICQYEKKGIQCSEIETFSDSIDEWIAEAFSRIQFQMQLFRQRHNSSFLMITRTKVPRLSDDFISLKEAWQTLQHFFQRIFYLSYLSYQDSTSNCKSLSNNIIALKQQTCIQEDLSHWLAKFKAFENQTNYWREVQPAARSKVYHLIYAYHIMATIMASTCLHSSYEMSYDHHIDHFIALLKQLTYLQPGDSKLSNHEGFSASPMDMAISIGDIGWIQLLFFVALKCRDPRIRSYAIKMLQTSVHREGIWDASIAVLVAKRVVRGEERDYYKSLNLVDELSISDLSSIPNPVLPVLPRSYRFCEVDLRLSGGPVDKILLHCKQNASGKVIDVLISQYDNHLQCWTDIVDPEPC